MSCPSTSAAWTGQPSSDATSRCSSDLPRISTMHLGWSRVRSPRSPCEAARITAGLLRLHADRVRTVEREARLRRRFATSHPDVRTAVLPALSTDVHDLEGLRAVGELLADQR